MERARWLIRWLTAGALVGAFYAHTILNIDSLTITPIVALLIAGLLSLSASLWFLRPTIPRPQTLAQKAGFFILSSALLLWILITLFHVVAGDMGSKDFGQVAIYCGLPILLLLNGDRIRTANAVGIVCVLASLSDLLFNIGVILHLWAPVTETMFVIGGQLYDRYPGLTGNVLAAGLVGMISSSYAAWRVRSAKSPKQMTFWLLILSATFVGLIAVEARRYLVETIVAVFLILAPNARKAPLWLVGPILAAFGLYQTFTSIESVDIERRTLMLYGLRDLIRNFWTGSGVLYREAPAGRLLSQLWNARVTESGFIDLALAFGAPAAGLFIFGVMVSLAERRAFPNWIVVLVAVMLGEFAYGGPLGGFLGASVFYLGLLILLLDEKPVAEVRPLPIRIFAPQAA